MHFLSSARPRAAAAAFAALALAGCARGPAVRAERAWVRPVEAGGTTAGYFTLVNDSADSLVLAAIESPAAERVQMHRTVREDGRVAMREAASFVVAPHAKLAFAPGGAHAMLLGARAALAEGDTTALVLRLADGRALRALAKVRS